jgi:WD40 repeat protein
MGPPLRHRYPVYAVAFSPDGRILFTASSEEKGGGKNGTAQLWSAKTGKRLGSALRHEGIPVGLPFSRDGKAVATARRDGTARLYSVETGQPLGIVLRQPFLRGAGFSADGKVVVTLGQTGKIRAWSAKTGKALGPELSDCINLLAISPDGQHLLTGQGFDAQLLSVREGLRYDSFLLNQRVAGGAGAFSPDGRAVLTNGDKTTARLRPAQNMAMSMVGVECALHHPEEVFHVAFSQDGKSFLTMDSGGTVRIWAAKIAYSPRAAARERDIRFVSTSPVAISPDGESLLTGNEDGTAQLWSTKGQLIRPFRPGPPLIGVGYGSTVLTRRIGPPLRHQSPITAGAVSPDGKRLLIAYKDGTARLWSAQTGQLLAPVLGHPDESSWIDSVAFSPDRKTLLTLGSSMQLWSAKTGKRLLRLTYALSPAAFTPDSNAILIATGEKKAQRCSIRTGKLFGPSLRHSAEITAMAFSRDGKTVLTGSADGAARLWSAQTGKPLGRVMWHQGSINALAFSPNGKSILISTGMGPAQVWSAQTARPLGPPLDVGGNSLAFGPDGKTVLGSWSMEPVPVAVEGSPERIKLWVQVLTGAELDEQGMPQALDAKTWQERRRRLEKLGGPPLP